MTRNVALDILKLGLSFIVVMLHCQLFKNIDDTLYHITVNGVFRVAVPVFLVITGYYFFLIDDLNKLLQWLKRILILYLIWMSFYISFWWSTTSVVENIKSLFWGYFVIWYLVGTLFSGLILYFFRKQRSTIQFVAALLTFLTGYTIQTLGNLHIFHGGMDSFLNETRNYRNFLLMCFPFMMLGFLINKHKLENKINIKISGIIFLLVLLIVESLINYYFVNKKESLDIIFSLFLVAPAIFIYTVNKKFYTRTKSLGTLSTGIYLIHPIIMFELAKKLNESNTISFTAFVLLLSVFLGYLLTLVNKKLKYLL
ncbi:MAG: acyltransferase family protein [Acinetobacter sp.]|jgi:surface polysaccharide O-acyltransferase-like enzyme